MKVSDIIVLLTSVLLFSACTEESIVMPENELVVVQAYLYASEEIRDIRLTSTLPLDVVDTNAQSINTAEVALHKNGIRYLLERSPGDSGYYHYSGSDLTVQVDDVFSIEVIYSEQHITGQTTVPSAPQNVTLSSDTLYIPTEFSFEERRGGLFDSLRIEVSWDENPDALYYVVIDNVEENPVEIESNLPSFPRKFISSPFGRNVFPIAFGSVTHLGKHRVKVYRVNQEYADLYETREQDSRDLNEPLTNIQNGLGVFSAFSSDSVFFLVEQE